MTAMGFEAHVCSLDFTLLLNPLPATWQSFWFNLLVSGAQLDNSTCDLREYVLSIRP